MTVFICGESFSLFTITSYNIILWKYRSIIHTRMENPCASATKQSISTLRWIGILMTLAMEYRSVLPTRIVMRSKHSMTSYYGLLLCSYMPCCLFHIHNKICILYIYICVYTPSKIESVILLLYKMVWWRFLLWFQALYLENSCALFSNYILGILFSRHILCIWLFVGRIDSYRTN